MQCFDVGTEIILAALIYIDRLLSLNKGLRLTELNAKPLLLSAMALAAKFYLDRFEKNTIFYAAGGLTKRRMRCLLDTFLELTDFRLNVEEEEFESLMSNMKSMIAHKYA